MNQEEQTEYIKAIINTFQFEHERYYICPKCRKYMIIPGYVCYGCGYDNSFD